MADHTYLIFCKNCKLVYYPDGRIHVDPEIYCPRCGFKVTEDKNMEEEMETQE